MARPELPKNRWVYLALSIILDLVSAASFGMPIIGEVRDSAAGMQLKTRKFHFRDVCI